MTAGCLPGIVSEAAVRRSVHHRRLIVAALISYLVTPLAGRIASRLAPSTSRAPPRHALPSRGADLGGL
jgi:hypothetical protein